MRAVLLVLWGVSILFAGAQALRAQEVTLDEGTFTIYEGDTEVGTETFSIRASGSGADRRVVAGARVHVTGGGSPRDTETALELRGDDEHVVRYTAQVAGAEPLDVRYEEDAPGRLSMIRRTSVGERAREMRAPDGMLVLDAGVVHHLHFAAARLRAGARQLPILVPIEGESGTVTLRDAGAGSVRVAGTEVSAQRMRVESSNGAALEVWLDGAGRVLAVERTAERGVAFRAVRTRVP
ncbi:MAG: hypothetical protein R3E98_21090 [Gemmatimonadota bacterium]|nr:hypothetical protein [Gemmatimonadota bacterium]